MRCPTRTFPWTMVARYGSQTWVGRRGVNKVFWGIFWEAVLGVEVRIFGVRIFGRQF